MRKPLLFHFLILFLVCGSLHAQIPASRTMDWSKAGAIGGITTYTTIVNFLSNGGVAGNTSFDNSVPLQTLVNAKAGTSTVIYFPPGTYRFKQKVTIPLAGRIILRGAGADSTKFEFETGTTNTGNFEVWGAQVGTPFNVTGGCTKGSTQIMLSNTTGLAVNNWIDISQDNDSLLMWTNNPSTALASGPRSVGQIMKITAVNGNTITVDRPLHYTYKLSLNVQVSECTMARKIGFEDFTIQSLLTGDKSHFVFVYAINCWVKCVRSIKSVSTHVNPSYCANLTIRDSYFHDSFDFGGGGHGYGVALSQHSTDCLVENNVFDKLRHAMMVQRGANGNVFGYNYSINATSDGNISPFGRITDGSLHGLFPYMNLYEGNVMQEIHSADTWGPSGYGNTFFRNRITREGIRISDRSLEQNIAGNDLRKDATATFTSNVINNESGVINTLIHGNKVGGTVSWDAALGSNNIINSYYLTSAPAFFNGAQWPPLGPEAACATGTIPAETRFGLGYDTECESPATTTAISENINPNNISAYPNPASSSITVEFRLENAGEMKVQFINAMGQVVKNENYGSYNAGNHSLKISVAELPVGIYALSISSGNSFYQKSILIIK